MKNFEYYTPTRVIFGLRTEERVGELVKKYGGSRVLVHYGSGSAEKSGLLDRIYASLSEAGISYLSLGGVKPNPRLSLAHEGIELCLREGVDFVLAVGGGSVIDSSKCIAYGVPYEGEVWDIYEKKVIAKEMLPIGVVLTIAATGSEMSDSSVITNEDGWLKRGVHSDLSRAKFAVMNPELTYTLPAWQTMSGVTDIMMHTMERYFSHEKDTELTDALAEGLLKTVMKAGRVLKQDPYNYDARAEIMWAGSLSHNGLTGCGRQGDWAAHQIEHELGGMFDVTHGAGLSAVWGSWARYVLDSDVPRFSQFALRVAGVLDDPSDPRGTALRGIEAIEDYFREIGMPVSLSELGLTLTEEEIRELSWKCTYMGKRTIGGIRVLRQEDIEEIYRMAK